MDLRIPACDFSFLFFLILFFRFCFVIFFRPPAKSEQGLSVQFLCIIDESVHSASKSAIGSRAYSCGFESGLND